MEEEKLLCGLNYKSLNFTDAQYEAALKLIKEPKSANQLLLALLDVSSNVSNETINATTSTCCANTKANRTTEGKTELSRTNSSHDKTSSGCSSLISFPSSSNQSLESLNQPHVDLRKIYIDGSNIARTHGKDAIFSWTGIQICVQWFHSRQHYVKVFVPEYRCESADDQALAYLNELDALIKTPNECNDDLFVIQAARENNGIIVSNDQYRNEKNSDTELRRFIDLNRLPYVFVDNQFIPAPDPRGRSGPMLNEFLRDQPEPGTHRRLYRQRNQRNGVFFRSQKCISVPNKSGIRSLCSAPTSSK